MGRMPLTLSWTQPVLRHSVPIKCEPSTIFSARCPVRLPESEAGASRARKKNWHCIFSFAAHFMHATNGKASQDDFLAVLRGNQTHLQPHCWHPEFLGTAVAQEAGFGGLADDPLARSKLGQYFPVRGARGPLNPVRCGARHFAWGRGNAPQSRMPEDKARQKPARTSIQQRLGDLARLLGRRAARQAQEAQAEHDKSRDQVRDQNGDRKLSPDED